MNPNEATSFMKFREEAKLHKEKLEDLRRELGRTANIFFSSEEGRKYGRQLLKAVSYFNSLPSDINNDKLRYIQAQRDLVDVFVVDLISNETLVKLIKD